MVTIAEIKKDWKKWPNVITILRLIFSPLPGLIYFFNPDNVMLRWVAATIFVIIAISDILDGYLARRLCQITTLGQSLDPLADKFLVIFTLFAVCLINPFIWLPALIILLRELAVTLIRDRAKRKGITIAAIPCGKRKMVMQSIASTLVLLPLGGVWQLITTVTMVAAVALTLMSWYEYHLRYSVYMEHV